MFQACSTAERIKHWSAFSWSVCAKDFLAELTSLFMSEYQDFEMLKTTMQKIMRLAGKCQGQEAEQVFETFRAGFGLVSMLCFGSFVHCQPWTLHSSRDFYHVFCRPD